MNVNTTFNRNCIWMIGQRSHWWCWAEVVYRVPTPNSKLQLSSTTTTSTWLSPGLSVVLRSVVCLFSFAPFHGVCLCVCLCVSISNRSAGICVLCCVYLCGYVCVHKYLRRISAFRRGMKEKKRACIQPTNQPPAAASKVLLSPKAVQRSLLLLLWLWWLTLEPLFYDLN